MKTLLFAFLTLILTVSGCNALQNKPVEYTGSPILEFYRQYSPFTDPGPYRYLYKNLPDSLPELCRVVRSQFLHPFAELPQYRDQIPAERGDESVKYPTVKSILEGLLAYDSRGLINDRKPKDRLILGCRENAILLASILKYRGIPARIRIGHAAYLMPGFHASHTLCEVWNEKDKRWMLVDPSTGMIDFSKEQFDFSNEVWLKMQKKEIDPNLYGLPGRYTGLVSIVGKMSPDLASVLGTEYPIYQYAPVLDYAFKNKNQLTAEQIEILNRVSELMKSLDADNLLKLQEIYNATPEIQVTMSFESNAAKSENTAKEKDLANEKPNIEFVDIPAGTFTMGSPVSEEGRKDDEVQHKVSLSAFKMSKYCVTVDQYKLFCKAKGKRLWLPPYWGQANMPVTQVSWHDAAAFAEWMGCRLPTEAEFEYAARANTTTPFYTGNCLTTDQANFKGDEPYANCGKGIYREKPTTVGSFAPNNFGLYDMHGNMVQWCSDWYGEYNINDKTNPKGPDTGGIKVFRGGGFWTPAWRCRSACRGGDPQVHRGAGLSFRIVKDK